MANNFNFVSPSVKFNESTVTAQNVEVLSQTALGIIGEFQTGPAFEPFTVNTKNALRKIFGRNSVRTRLNGVPKFLGTLAADLFLEESNNLTLMRVLGKGGYTAKPGFFVKHNNIIVALIRQRGTTTGVPPSVDLLNIMNPASPSYAVKLYGTDPIRGAQPYYVEFIAEEYLKELYEVSTGFSFTTEATQTGAESDYTSNYRYSETPWIVSGITQGTVGQQPQRLFKFRTISDGDLSTKLVKVSIENIDLSRFEFDVVVRSFDDTDTRPSILERFRRCNLDEASNNFIGKRIGAVNSATEDRFKYARVSDYVYLVFPEQDPDPQSFPAGFEGYALKADGVNDTFESALKFKTTYTTAEESRLSRSYLGVTEKAYTGVNQLRGDLFTYKGRFATLDDPQDGTTRGFHMDSGANVAEFFRPNAVGSEYEFRTAEGVANPSNRYNAVASRKFTVAFQAGFDGWDIYKTEREYFDVTSNDYDAFTDAIDRLSNPEESEFNLLITPNINWNDHTQLTQDVLEMVETRGDALYITDAPDFGSSPNLASQYAQAFETVGIDSNYAATYAPWIELDDPEDNIRIMVPPSIDLPRLAAFTDNRRFPWFAVAGLNRGVSIAINTRKSFKEPERDILYEARINPILNSKQDGVVVFGNKNTQIADDPLDRINVRRLLLFAKKAISTIARRLLFDPNDDILRERFLDTTNAILETIRLNRGLFDFRILDDGLNPENIDQNAATFTLKLKTTPTAEFIGIDLEVFELGASFDD